MCRTRGVGSSRQGGAGPGKLLLQNLIPIDHSQRSLGTTGKRLWQPGHALAKRMRLAEGHWARQRDSHDRRTGLRLAATSGKAIPTVSPAQRKGGSVSASPAKRPLGCSERCIRNLAARQRRQSQRFLRLPLLRLHWRRSAIRGKIQPRRLSVPHKPQRLILLGDDDGSGHCEVVQSNEELWIHSAARWWRQRCVRTPAQLNAPV